MSDYEPTLFDICSGIGGFSIGFEAAGFRTIGFAEIDPYACAVIRHHFPGVPNYGDVRNLPAIPCNVLSAGFPCQPFSIAGRRKGTADHRNLWPSVLEAVERCQPDFFVGENVVNIKNMVLARCLDDLEERGYQSKVFDIPSCGVGLPSVERHVWIVAEGYIKRWQRNGEKGLSRESVCESVRRATYTGIARKLPIPDLPERRLCRGPKGIFSRLDRIRCIGNAVPPPVVYEIAKAIRQFYP